MWSLGQGGSAAGRIPVSSRAVSAGEVAGKGLGFTRARFGPLLAVGRWLEGLGGGVKRRPLRLL
jgi:hypothetical protein